MANDHAHITKLHNKFLAKMKKEITNIEINGDEVIKKSNCQFERYVGNLNISFSCVEGESLIMAVRTVAVSSGSACTSASLEPSYVLRSLGVDEEMAHTSIRFGFG
jgi:cysteine desulfurase